VLNAIAHLPLELVAPDVILAELRAPDRASLLTSDGPSGRPPPAKAYPLTLWLLDELVDRRILSPNAAAEGLERMLARGSRLPEAECPHRLRDWTSRP